MSSKKKFIVALSSLGVVCVALIISLVCVLAASKVTVTSGVNIGYTAQEVAGTITGSYKQASANSYTEIGSVTLSGEDEDNSTKSLGNTVEVTLSKSNKEVVFKFDFTKASGDGIRNYTATLTDTATTSTNVTVTYSLDGTTYAATTSKTLTVSSTTATSFYVKVAITDLAKDASYEASYSWALTAVTSE